MAKAWTPEQNERRHRDGRGRGEGLKYRSWLLAHDVPSRGRTTRLTGRKVVRQYVVFSDGELHTLLALQRLGRVTDIREQFPLWPIEETERIAARIGVAHPARDGRNTVMTTDFMVTVADGACRGLEAVACKPWKALDDRRTLEKLEIERVYWRERDVPFGLCTERELPEGLVSNLKWMDECHDLPSAIPPDMLGAVLGRVRELSDADAELPLMDACWTADADLALASGACLSGMRHAMARGLWTPRLDREIDSRLPLAALGCDGAWPAHVPGRTEAP